MDPNDRNYTPERIRTFRKDLERGDTRSYEAHRSSILAEIVGSGKAAKVEHTINDRWTEDKIRALREDAVRTGDWSEYQRHRQSILNQLAQSKGR